MDILTELIRGSEVGLSHFTLRIVFYVLWLLVEWYIIVRIVRSRFVKSDNERTLWIMFCIVTWLIGGIVFFVVTKARFKEKYHLTKQNNTKSEVS